MASGPVGPLVENQVCGLATHFSGLGHILKSNCYVMLCYSEILDQHKDKKGDISSAKAKEDCSSEVTEISRVTVNICVRYVPVIGKVRCLLFCLLVLGV